MAKIKVKGINEFIIVDNKEAKAIKEQIQNKELDPNQMVSVGNAAIPVKEITAILLDQEYSKDLKFEKKLADENMTRQIFINSSVEDKAKKNLSYFKFLFKSKHGKDPDEKELKLAEKLAIDFFKNDEDGVYRAWVRPDVWFKGFSEENFKVRGPFAGFAFKLAERIEKNEINETCMKKKEEQALFDSVEKSLV